MHFNKKDASHQIAFGYEGKQERMREQEIERKGEEKRSGYKMTQYS